MEISISQKKVGGKNPIFIIAEAGVNHNGRLKKAKELVDAAAEANSDAIKFQTYTAEKLVTNTIGRLQYQKSHTKKNETQQQMLKKLELHHNDFIKLKKYCDKKKILFLSTPHSFDAIDFLEPIVPAYKFGSGDLTNIPSLEYAASKKKPIMLGTGMSTMAEVKTAVSSIKKKGNKKIILLHCTTAYPCPIKEVNLRAMVTIKEKLGCVTGYSDHTLGLKTPLIAAALGASVIEKHLTLDKNLEGPDHKASLNPKEFSEMVKTIRKVEIILGSKLKKPTDSEKKISDMIRKSLIAQETIKKGDVVTKDKIIIKRPGWGIQPRYMPKILGKKAKKTIQKDEVIKKESIE